MWRPGRNLLGEAVFCRRLGPGLVMLFADGAADFTTGAVTGVARSPLKALPQGGGRRRLVQSFLA